jgi:hypothetical protein
MRGLYGAPSPWLWQKACGRKFPNLARAGAFPFFGRSMRTCWAWDLQALLLAVVGAVASLLGPPSGDWWWHRHSVFSWHLASGPRSAC